MKTRILFSKTVSLMVYCLFSTAIFAQNTPLPKQWDKRFGGSSGDVFNSMQTTNDGGYILVGTSSSPIGGDKTEDTRGSTDFWAVKIDANGIKQWDKRFGGSSSDGCFSVQQTTDGGYILGGYSSSGIGGDKTEDTRGSADYWVVKIDVNGIKQWDKRFGGTNLDYCISIQQTTDDGYVLGGYSNSWIGGDKTENCRGYMDYWAVKIDSNGEKQWDKRFGGRNDDVLHTIRQTTDGGYLLGGYSQSDTGWDKTDSNRSSVGVDDYWLIKIDSNGGKLWDKCYGGTRNDDLSSILESTDGKYYILGGYTQSDRGGEVTEKGRGLDDYWVVKIDLNGVKLWDKRFGGKNVDRCLSIQKTTDGGYILGGYSSSGIGGDKTEDSRGDLDYWVVKIDSIGKKLWDKRFGGSKRDYGNSIQQAIDGGYILGGYSYSKIGGDKTQGLRGSEDDYDFWVVKMGCPPSARVIPIGNLDICQSGSVVLKADANTGVHYHWLKDGVKIPGAIKRKYTATEPGKYQVVVYIDSGCSSISRGLNVTNSCKTNKGNIAQSITNSLAITNVLLSPNPSKGNITVAYHSAVSGKIQLNVFDINGKILFTKSEQVISGKNSYQLNLSIFKAGVYTLQITNGNETKYVKFVIEK